MRALKTIFTAEELALLPTTSRRLELVKGEVYETPAAGARHGDVAAEIGAQLRTYVRANRLGRVFAAETGFLLRRDPDTIRAPDAAFVTQDRLPEEGLPTGYFEGAPDLAVEVLSPDDRPRDVRQKANDWLQAGSRLVWVIDPGTRSVTVYSSPEAFQELTEDDSLEGEHVIPGFACSIRGLFS